MRRPLESAGPGPHKIELNKSANALEVSLVVGHENASGFTARQREQDIVGERFRHTSDRESFPPRHFGEQIARSVPGLGRRDDDSLCPSEELENIPLQGLPVLRAFHAGAELLGHDDAEVLVR